LSRLGIGTWAWGDRGIWGYGSRYGEPEVRAAFSAAVEAGITLFDTAELYGDGESERLLGRFMRDSGRDDVQIATKFFPFPWRLFQKGSVLRALRASLERLGVPQVALYQIHWSLPLLRGDFWAAELAEAVQSGLTRGVGVSNYDAHDLRRVHAALDRRGVALVSNQVAYSLLDRAPERNGVLAACRELNVELIAYSPLAMGLLGGRYGPDRPPPGYRRVRVGRKLRRSGTVLPALREIGAAHGDRTPAQVALNWLIAHGAIPIPGAKNEAQARDNAAALGWQLEPDELARLDRLSAD
jgi:aryl-alcohol dehydrogenase-like predicted oxidoreductase